MDDAVSRSSCSTLCKTVQLLIAFSLAEFDEISSTCALSTHAMLIGRTVLLPDLSNVAA